MSQTSITSKMDAAYAGMMRDDNYDNFTVPGISEEVALETPFGVAVARGTVDDGVKLPAAANAKIKGVVRHSHHYDKTSELGTIGLKPKTLMNVLRKGRIYVTVEENVAPGDRAHIRYAAGAGGTQLGAFRKSSVVNETLDLTTCAEFQTTALAGGIAVVDVDFTNEP